jgi:translation initiation factor IF-3
MTRQSLGRQILERLIKDVDQRGLVEFRPRQEGNTLHLILAPNKKEGGGKEKPTPPKAAPPQAPRGGAQTA